MKKILLLLSFIFLTGCIGDIPQNQIKDVIDDAKASAFKSEVALIVNSFEMECVMNSVSLNDKNLIEYCDSSVLTHEQVYKYVSILGNTKIEELKISDSKVTYGMFTYEGLKVEYENGELGSVTNK